MTVTTGIPALKELRDTVSALIGKEVGLATGAVPPSVGGASGSLVGLYVDDSLRSAAVIVLDLPLAARLGAAIGLVPPGGADAAVEDGALSPVLRENATEILNVLASVFNVDGAPHLGLYSVAGSAEELRADVRALAVKAAPRQDVTIEVPRYGAGVLSVVIA